MNRNIPTLVLVVFAGVVFVLGYVIVQRAGLLFESEVDNVQEFSPFAFVEPKNVLNWPSMEASDNEKQQHTQLIVSLAQQADTLEIKEGCMVSPVVLGIQLKASVVVANLDSVLHVLQHESANFKLEILPGEENVIVADFPQGVGDYGYRCDNKPGIVGILHVAP